MRPVRPSSEPNSIWASLFMALLQKTEHPALAGDHPPFSRMSGDPSPRARGCRALQGRRNHQDFVSDDGFSKTARKAPKALARHRPCKFFRWPKAAFPGFPEGPARIDTKTSKSQLTAGVPAFTRLLVAQMAELVDAPASGAGTRKGVEVRVLFWAPNSPLHYQERRQKSPVQPGFFVG